MHVFRHPKYYEEYRKRAKRYQKELRERNKSDQAISKRQPTGESERASWSGPQATSPKPQAKASSHKPQAKASSHKPKHLA